MLKYLVVIVLYLGVTTCAYGQPPHNDYQLMLVGVVLDSVTQVPIPNASLALIDRSNDAKRMSTTKKDGQFQIGLKPDCDYEISTVLGTQVLDTKRINTAGREKSEVLYVILSGALSDTLAKENDNYSILVPRKKVSGTKSGMDILLINGADTKLNFERID